MFVYTFDSVCLRIINYCVPSSFILFIVYMAMNNEKFSGLCLEHSLVTFFLFLSTVYTLYYLTVNIEPKCPALINLIIMLIKKLPNTIRDLYLSFMLIRLGVFQKTVIALVLGLILTLALVFIFFCYTVFIAITVGNVYYLFGLEKNLEFLFSCILIIFALWAPFTFLVIVFINFAKFIIFPKKDVNFYSVVISCIPKLNSIITKENLALKLVLIFFFIISFRFLHLEEFFEKLYKDLADYIWRIGSRLIEIKNNFSHHFFNIMEEMKGYFREEISKYLIDYPWLRETPPWNAINAVFGLDNDDLNQEFEEYDELPSRKKHFTVGEETPLLYKNELIYPSSLYKEYGDNSEILTSSQLEQRNFTKYDSWYVKFNDKGKSQTVPYESNIETEYYAIVGPDAYVSSSTLKANATRYINNVVTKCSQPADWLNFLPDTFELTHLKEDCFIHDPTVRNAILLLNDESPEDKIGGALTAFFNCTFGTKDGFFVCTEQRTGIGRVDVGISYKDPTDPRVLPFTTLGKVEYKKVSGDSWLSLLEQLAGYAEHDSQITNPLLIGVKGKQLSFFVFERDWHSANGFLRKGLHYDGILGLEVTPEGIGVLAQDNWFAPNMRTYTIYGDKIDNFCIYAILKYYKMGTEAPAVSKNIMCSWEVGQKPKLCIALEAQKLSLEQNAFKSIPIADKIPINGSSGTLGLGLNKLGVFRFNVKNNS